MVWGSKVSLDVNFGDATLVPLTIDILSAMCRLVLGDRSRGRIVLVSVRDFGENATTAIPMPHLDSLEKELQFDKSRSETASKTIEIGFKGPQ